MTAYHIVEILIWIISIALVLVGVIGVLLPALPGPFLILTGVLLHKFLIPDCLSWWTVVLIGVGVFFCVLTDWLFLIFGMKGAGATKWGIAGACIGLSVGIFLGVFGVLIAPVIGALLGEFLISKREIKDASFAGIMAGLGIIIGTLFRFMIALLMLLAFVLNCLWSTLGVGAFHVLK